MDGFLATTWWPYQFGTEWYYNKMVLCQGLLIGEASPKWAHWNSGMGNLLQLLLIRKTRPVSYGWAVRTYLRGGSVPKMSLSVRPLVNKS